MALVASVPAQASNNSSTLEAQVEAARTALRLAVQAPPRCHRDADCRLVAVGSDACGGPEAYWIWSSVVHDERRVLQAARELTERRRQQHEVSGAASTCRVLGEPSVRCEQRGQTARNASSGVSAEPSGLCVMEPQLNRP